MSTLLFLPLIATALLALTVTSAHRYLRPAIAARVTLVAMVAIAAAAIPSMWVLSIAYLAHVPIIGIGLRWCAMAFGLHHQIPAALGIPATAITIIGAPRAARVVRLERRARLNAPGPIEFIENTEPFAVTIPGTGGRIVISTGLVDLVNDRELDAVIAHERTHAYHRHDRFMLCARLVTALLPLTQPITSRLHFALERWADEAAASQCGDRNLVAHTLAKVALHEPAPTYALGFGTLGVVNRVESLLDTPRPVAGRPAMLAIWAGTLTATGLAVLQLHHLGPLIGILCPR